MEHLEGMGERTASLSRQYQVGRDSFLAMAAIYNGSKIHYYVQDH